MLIIDRQSRKIEEVGCLFSSEQDRILVHELTHIAKKSLEPFARIISDPLANELISSITDVLFSRFRHIPKMRLLASPAEHPLTSEVLDLTTSLLSSAGPYYDITDVPMLLKSLSGKLFSNEVLKSVLSATRKSEHNPLSDKFDANKAVAAFDESLDQSISRICDLDRDKVIALKSVSGAWKLIDSPLTYHTQVLEISRVRNYSGSGYNKYRVRSAPWFSERSFGDYRSSMFPGNYRSPWFRTPNHFAFERLNAIQELSGRLPSSIPGISMNPILFVQASTLRGGAGPESRVLTSAVIRTTENGILAIITNLPVIERTFEGITKASLSGDPGSTKPLIQFFVTSSEQGLALEVTQSGLRPCAALVFQDGGLYSQVDPDQPGVRAFINGRSHFKRRVKGSSEVRIDCR